MSLTRAYFQYLALVIIFTSFSAYGMEKPFALSELYMLVGRLCKETTDPYNSLNIVDKTVIQLVPISQRTIVFHQLLHLEPFNNHVEAILKQLTFLLHQVQCVTVNRLIEEIGQAIAKKLSPSMTKFILHRFAIRYDWHDLAPFYTTHEIESPIKAIQLLPEDRLLITSKDANSPKPIILLPFTHSAQQYSDQTGTLANRRFLITKLSKPSKTGFNLFYNDTYLCAKDSETDTSLEIPILNSLIVIDIGFEETNTREDLSNNHFSGASIALDEIQFSPGNTYLVFRALIVDNNANRWPLLRVYNLKEKKYTLSITNLDNLTVSTYLSGSSFRLVSLKNIALTIKMTNRFGTLTIEITTQSEKKVTSTLQLPYSISILPLDRTENYQVAFTHDDRLILIGPLLFNPATGEQICNFSSIIPNFIALSVDDSLIALATKHGNIEVYKKASFKQLLLKQAITNSIRYIHQIRIVNHEKFAQIPIPSNHSLQKYFLRKLSNDTIPKQQNAYKQEFIPSQSGHLKDAQKVYTALSIDSGGIYSIIPAVLLRVIEKTYNIPIHKLFDCICSAGLGATVALCFTATKNDFDPAWQSDDIVNLFYKHGTTLFAQKYKQSRTPLYKETGLNTILKSYFSGMDLSDTLTQVIIPYIDEHAHQPKLFDSLEAQKSISLDFPMDLVARAACADGKYFPLTTIWNSNRSKKIVCRGKEPLFNPSRYIVRELEKKSSSKDNIRLLSLGACLFKQQQALEEATAIEAHEELKDYLGNTAYRRLQPVVKEFGNVDDPNKELLDQYIAAAEKLVSGNETFFTKLLESRAPSL